MVGDEWGQVTERNGRRATVRWRRHEMFLQYVQNFGKNQLRVFQVGLKAVNGVFGFLGRAPPSQLLADGHQLVGNIREPSLQRLVVANERENAYHLGAHLNDNWNSMKLNELVNVEMVLVRLG